ncbi:hypothetical protein ABW20_dc0106274 [Dactylellina cionopaga]|nr:hypothetical protein ABW20_dc0106274 [Dactylellina cionopaga]
MAVFRTFDQKLCQRDGTCNRCIRHAAMAAPVFGKDVVTSRKVGIIRPFNTFRGFSDENVDHVRTTSYSLVDTNVRSPFMIFIILN